MAARVAGRKVEHRAERSPASTAPTRPRKKDSAFKAPVDSMAEPREATVHEAKTHLSRLLAEVEAGGSVVITRRGKPVAKLEAVAPKRRPVFGSMRGLIAIDDRFFEPLPDEELEAWGLL